MNFQNESKISIPNPSIIEIVKLYIARLREKGLILSKVILYGSQARGDYSASSDIDLVLISPEFDVNPNAHTPLLWLTAADTDYRIEPMAIGKLKFENDDISPIIAIAKQEGIEI